jgi:alkylhydroperoxidase family enzyme
MLADFAARLTRAPWAMRESDVVALRVAGFSDTAILDAVQIVGYFNLVNRLTLGLGVELDAKGDVGQNQV